MIYIFRSVFFEFRLRVISFPDLLWAKIWERHYLEAVSFPGLFLLKLISSGNDVELKS